MLAVSVISPNQPGSRPIIRRSQSTVTSSSSVSAGDVRQSIPFTLSAAVNSSPMMPGAEPVIAK